MQGPLREDLTRIPVFADILWFLAAESLSLAVGSVYMFV